jgi:hypothetical protein
MPKAWQDNITTSWFRAAFLNIFYNHINPLGLKIQPLTLVLQTGIGISTPFQVKAEDRSLSFF